MNTVSFTAMADGTADDYALLETLEASFNRDLPVRILAMLRRLENSLSGYQVSRLEHSLQSATRAFLDGRSEEYVVAALVHDIGDELAPFSHSEMAAAILRPFVDEKLYWIVRTHGVFQMVYYAHHVGGNPNERERYRDHPWYADACEFCERYDQNCFDPAFVSKPLAFFQPMVERVFTRRPFDRAQRERDQ